MNDSDESTITEFDETWYLRRYPEVARHIGPGGFKSALHHYLKHGRKEGRHPVPPADVPQPDVDAIRAEAPSHRGTGYLTPTTLRLTPQDPINLALIGSCMMQGWNLKAQTGEIARLDHYVVNSGSQLPPKSPSELAGYDFAVIQVPIRSITGDAFLWHLNSDDLAGHQSYFQDCCDRLRQYLSNWMCWNREHGLLTFVCNFFVPQSNPIGRLFPRYDIRNPQHFIEKLNEQLESIVRQNANAFVFDIDRIFASFGRRYTQDDITEFMSHGSFIAYSSPLTDRIEPVAGLSEYYEPNWPQTVRPAVWAELVAMYRTARALDAVKLVVTDLDDTLWCGVSGEMAEIDPFAMTEGWPIGFAESLMYLRKRGVLLAIMSKNDAKRISDIFPQVWGNRLRMEDFAAVVVNWQPKTENMTELLATMSLLPRNVVFIDDNPVERAAMSAAFPEMRVLGRHLRWIRRILLWSAETDVANISEESARRTEMMRHQISREHQRKSLSREDFLKSASPSVEILEIQDPNHPRFARVVELTNKTNQFNTIGRRWKQEELLAHLTSGGRIFTFNVTDSFTNYGLVGVVLVRGSHIVQWVMSCRVLGYQIEQAVMGAIVPLIRSEGAPDVSGDLINTDTNFPCRSLFSGCGFAQNGQTWHLPPGSMIDMPTHVAMKVLST